MILTLEQAAKIRTKQQADAKRRDTIEQNKLKIDKYNEAKKRLNSWYKRIGYKTMSQENFDIWKKNKLAEYR